MIKKMHIHAEEKFSQENMGCPEIKTKETKNFWQFFWKKLPFSPWSIEVWSTETNSLRFNRCINFLFKIHKHFSLEISIYSWLYTGVLRELTFFQSVWISKISQFLANIWTINSLRITDYFKTGWQSTDLEGWDEQY